MIDKKKFIGVMLAGVLAVGGVTAAFAAEEPAADKQPQGRQRQEVRFNKEELSAKIKSAVESLVTAGTLTQEQAEAVIKAYTLGEDRAKKEEQKEEMQKSSQDKGMVQEKGERRPISLDKLVEEGIITKAQADAFNEAVKGLRTGRKSTEDILKELVESGKITQAQADSFTEVMKLIREAEKTTADVLKEMVTAGTITQEQADAIRKLFTPGKGRGFEAGFGNKMLDKLVEAGTITQEQVNAVSEAVKAVLGNKEN